MHFARYPSHSLFDEGTWVNVVCKWKWWNLQGPGLAFCFNSVLLFRPNLNVAFIAALFVSLLAKIWLYMSVCVVVAYQNLRFSVQNDQFYSLIPCLLKVYIHPSVMVPQKHTVCPGTNLLWPLKPIPQATVVFWRRVARRSQSETRPRAAEPITVTAIPYIYVNWFPTGWNSTCNTHVFQSLRSECWASVGASMTDMSWKSCRSSKKVCFSPTFSPTFSAAFGFYVKLRVCAHRIWGWSKGDGHASVSFSCWL